jgi:hypothetical protein
LKVRLLLGLLLLEVKAAGLTTHPPRLARLRPPVGRVGTIAVDRSR